MCTIPRSTGVLASVILVLAASCGSQYDLDAIAAVKATVTTGRDDTGTWKTAPMKGGVAVLSSRDWAYWVKDGKVYIPVGQRNLAMSASPGLPRAPGIEFSEIEELFE